MQADGEVNGPEGHAAKHGRLVALEGAQAENPHPERERDGAQEHGAGDELLLRERDAPGRLRQRDAKSTRVRTAQEHSGSRHKSISTQHKYRLLLNGWTRYKLFVNNLFHAKGEPSTAASKKHEAAVPLHAPCHIRTTSPAAHKTTRQLPYHLPSFSATEVLTQTRNTSPAIQQTTTNIDLACSFLSARAHTAQQHLPPLPPPSKKEQMCVLGWAQKGTYRLSVGLSYCSVSKQEAVHVITPAERTLSRTSSRGPPSKPASHGWTETLATTRTPVPRGK